MLRLILLVFAASYLVTDTFSFGYAIPTWKKLLPVRLTQPFADAQAKREFTASSLKQYDGKVEGNPVYLAIAYVWGLGAYHASGKVFDVTAGKEKYLGTSYAGFLGRDASRSFATGCLEDENQLTHDVRGITSGQRKHLEQWIKYYQRHPDYHQVGCVKLEEPSGPVPGPCKGPSPHGMPVQGTRPGSSHY